MNSLASTGWGRLAADRNRLIITTLIAIMSLVTVVVGVAGAVFTDTAAVTGNVFSTGNVEISTSPATAVVTFNAMVPGDKVTAPIDVSNDGTVELRYAVTGAVASGDVTLPAQLDLTAKSGVTTCTNSGFGADGTAIYGPGDLATGATPINLIGDPAQGADSGDRVLAASATEELCLQVALPLATGNAYESLTTTVTLSFEAEQTASNL